MPVRTIRKRRNRYALFFAVSVSLAVWFGVQGAVEVSFIFVVLALMGFILLFKESRMLNDAAFIWENRILTVPTHSTTSRKEKDAVDETVLSSFGLLINGKIYPWNRNGVHGVRLIATEIDRKRIYLTFGDKARIMRVELLHAMVEEQVLEDVKQKLWHETGVMASVRDW